ncbi:BTAD domain-containing putative transcriptional regulator [Streptomyces sp. NPDC090442]|uniref:AfsR/SARP family transcriptional regulator n=1 Tax=Streptomyces sp. NPDC090442 TaxID=3365962 RepID=UPI003817F4F7
MVELLALGPLELWHEGRQHGLGSPKERCVLASLLYAQGDPVTVDTLMARVWEDDDLPETPLESLYSHLSRLRGRLRQAVGDRVSVERCPTRRYRLRVIDRNDVDLCRLRRLRREARAAADRGDREFAAGQLLAAEALWRGEPFVEFSGAWAAAARTRLTEDHRHIREERIRLELELGRHAELIGELQEMVTQNPLAQRTVAALMLALYRCGRDGEALAHFRKAQRRLRDELGIDAGAELQDLQRRILAQDATLVCDRGPATMARPSATEEPRSSAAPHGASGGSAEPAADGVVQDGRATTGDTLPRDTKDFTGRRYELRYLLNSPSAVAHGAGTALPLTVVHGMPGVGKSALIVHAAHRLRPQYPEGRFYLDLRAYSDQPPYEPAEALASLLRSADLSGSLPDSLDERVVRWREWTAHRRVLVVLDNAKDAEQVRPLLPGAATCCAIVASRNRLAELDGAASVHLDVLPVSEASSLFSRIVGAYRTSDRAALRRVVELCNCHPLTVQLLAGRFRHRDTWDLEYVADRLAGAADRLDEFDERVEAAFLLSYGDLDAPAQHLFRHLAQHPGPDITLEAATALCGTAIAAVRRAADQLLDRHLLDEPVRERYQLHDLARAFARRVHSREDSAPARRDALRRLVAYYLTAADHADRLAHPRRRRRPIDAKLASPCVSAVPTVQGPRTSDSADAAAVWLTVECANLLAVARTAAAEFPEFAAHFSHVLAYSLKLWGTHDITTEVADAALTALRRGDDRQALAQTLVERASVLAQQKHAEALRCASEALLLYDELQDSHGRADALFEIGRAHLAAGRGEKCLAEVERALQLYREVGDLHGVAESLNVQGAWLIFSAEYPEAMRRFEKMLEIHRGLQDAHGQAKALNNIGEIHFTEGLYEEARGYYEQSLALVRRFGGLQEFAILDTNLGTVYRVTGQLELARECFLRALASNRARGDAVGEVNALTSLGATCAESGRTDEALQHFHAAEEVSRHIDSPYERHRALIGIADTLRSAGQLAAALEMYQDGLGIAQKHKFPLGAAHALAGIARTLLRTHETEAARRYAERALVLYHQLGAFVEGTELRRLLAGQKDTGP